MQRALLLNGCIFLLLLGWSLLPSVYRGWTILPLWIACTALIFTGSFEAARLRRRVWLDQYLLPASPWHRLLRGGVLMGVWHVLTGSLLSLFMLFKMQTLSAALWALLVAGVPLIAVLMRGLQTRLRVHVLPDVLPALVRRFAVPLAVSLLTVLYLIVTLSQGHADLRGMSWGAVMAEHLQPSPAPFAGMLFLDRLYLMQDLTLHWALQNGLGGTERSGGLALVGWSLLLLSGGAFILAYVRLMIGADALFSLRREAI